MSAPHNAVESLRDIVQDLLVPDIKATKVSVEGLHSEIGSLRTEIKLREEKMEQLVRSGDDKLDILIRTGDRQLEQLIHAGIEKNSQEIRRLSDKLDMYIDVRERLANLEARLPKQ